MKNKNNNIPFLKKSLSRNVYFENIVKTIREPLVVLDDDMRVVTANQSFYSTFIVKPKETENVHLYDLGNSQWDIPELRTLLSNILSKNTTIEDFEIKHTFETIGEKYMLLNARKIAAEESSDDSLILLAIEDITLRKQSENQIKQELAEKVNLLKEIQHRTKNNILSIKSLLTLQSKKIINIEARTILIEAINRIDSIYKIYEKLLITDDYKKISIKQYLEELILSIFNLFPEDKNISLSMNIIEMNMNVSKVYPLGAIINELITNSMKYAFIGKNKGKIKIILKKKDDNLILIVQDNGIGLPQNFDINSSKGLGLMLIKFLTRQLEGKLMIDSPCGVKYTLEFKY